MTELDENNAEDILIIAIETLYEVKIYDFNVLNPINFQMIIMCEHGLQYYPESVSIFAWLTKIYGKLGLIRAVNSLSDRFPTAPQALFEGLSLTRNAIIDIGKVKKGAQKEEFENLVDQDIEAMGATRFSLYTSYGFDDDLDELVENYEDYYRDRSEKNKNKVTTAFFERNFDIIHPTLQINDKVIQAPLKRTIGLGGTMCEIKKNIMNVPLIHTTFNENFKHIENICSNEFDEGFIVEKDPYEEVKKVIARKNFVVKDLRPLANLNKSRSYLNKQEVISAPYEDRAATLKRAMASDREANSTKSLVSVFGFKHYKALKFYGTLLTCLRDSYESKAE
jgi:hypothetical protein